MFDSKKLQQFTYKNSGDGLERGYGDVVLALFPNHEEFWRKFVVPMTRRYTKNNPKDIGSNEGLDLKLERLAMTHYTIFQSLVFAHNNLKDLMCSEDESSFKYFYTNISTVGDLFFDLVFLIVLIKENINDGYELERFFNENVGENKMNDCVGNVSEDFAKNYQNGLKSGMEKFWSKGHFDFRVQLDVREKVVEYYLKSIGASLSVTNTIKYIRTYRNVMVHNTQISRVVNRNMFFYVPKIKYLNDEQSRSWLLNANEIKDKEKFMQNFELMENNVRNVLRDFEKELDVVWGSLIQDVEKTFEVDSERIIKMYNVTMEYKEAELEETLDSFCRDNDHDPTFITPDSGVTVLPSGVYWDEKMSFKGWDEKTEENC